MIVMPARIAALPVDPQRGVPVPWFVQWFDGKPDFRVIGTGKIERCIRFKSCWICGQEVGRNMTFNLGPMCGVTRTSAEPPSHRDCAIYAAEVCPFLTKPNMRRREKGLPDERIAPPGEMILRNPGVALVWSCRDYKLFADPRNGGTLFKVGDPTETLWFCEGRAATRAEVDASIESGLPLLKAEDEGPEAVAELKRMVEVARRFMPAAAVAP